MMEKTVASPWDILSGNNTEISGIGYKKTIINNFESKLSLKDVEDSKEKIKHQKRKASGNVGTGLKKVNIRNTSGKTGVNKDRGCWVASATLNRKKINLYRGKSLDDAIKAREIFEKCNANKVKLIKQVEKTGKIGVYRRILNGRIRYSAWGSKDGKKIYLYSGKSLEAAIKARAKYEKDNGIIINSNVSMGTIRGTRKHRNNTTGHKGVFYEKSTGSWKASAMEAGDTYWFYCGKSEKLAIHARKDWDNGVDVEIIKQKYSLAGYKTYNEERRVIGVRDNNNRTTYVVRPGGKKTLYAGKNIIKASAARMEYNLTLFPDLTGGIFIKLIDGYNRYVILATDTDNDSDIAIYDTELFNLLAIVDKSIINGDIKINGRGVIYDKDILDDFEYKKEDLKIMNDIFNNVKKPKVNYYQQSKVVTVFRWLELTNPRQAGLTRDEAQEFGIIRKKACFDAGVTCGALRSYKSRGSIGAKVTNRMAEATKNNKIKIGYIDE